MQINPRKNYKKKHRKLAVSALLLLAIALLVCAFFIFKPQKTKVFKEYPLPFKQLHDFSNNPPKSIDIRLPDGSHNKIDIIDNKLFLEDGSPVDRDIAQSMLGYINKIYVEDVVDENNFNPTAEMGLNPPLLSVEVLYKNGEKLALYSGKPVPLMQCTYFASSKDKGIYCMTQGFEETFSKKKEELYQRQSLDIKRGQIANIKFAGKDRADISKNQKDSFEINIKSYEKDGVYGDVIADFIYPANTKSLQNICYALYNIEFGVFIKDYSEEDNKSYGFSGDSSLSIEISQSNNSVTKLLLGNKADDFSAYALYNNKIYRISSISIAPIWDISLSKVLSPNVFTLSLKDISNIVSIVDEYDNNTNLWQMYSKQEQDKETIIIKKNGTSYNTESFLDIIKNMRSASAELLLEKDITKTKATRKITVNFKNARPYTIEFYDYDSYFDAFSVNGNMFFRWSKEKTLSLMPLD